MLWWLRVVTETIPLVRLQLPPLSSHSHELSVPILFHACHQNKSHRKGIMDSHRHEVRKCTRCGASKLAVVVHRRRPAFQVIQQKVIEHSKGKHGLWVDEGCRKESCPEELYVWLLAAGHWQHRICRQCTPDVSTMSISAPLSLYRGPGMEGLSSRSISSSASSPSKISHPSSAAAHPVAS